MNYRHQTRSRVQAKVFLSNDKIFWTLLALIGFFILFYAYFINATVLTTASLQNIEEEIVDTRSEISQLEFALIEGNKNLTMEFASNLGLVEVSDTVFVARNSASLSLND